MELRDGDNKRYDGKGVQKAVENVNAIILEALVTGGSGENAGKDFDQRSL
ncbi:MAG: Enolase, N-terminal domain, partial [Verrucomicrobiota bacterium]